MSKPTNDLGAFLHAKSRKSNEELAESIRVSKKLSKTHSLKASISTLTVY